MRRMPISTQRFEPTPVPRPPDTRYPLRGTPRQAPSPYNRYIVLCVEPGSKVPRPVTKEHSCYLSYLPWRYGVRVDYRTPDAPRYVVEMLNANSSHVEYRVAEVDA